MRFRTNYGSIKVLRQCLLCLHKISPEVVIEMSRANWQLSVISPSQSSYAIVTFEKKFFDVLEPLEETFKLKVLIKAILHAIPSKDDGRLEYVEWRVEEDRFISELVLKSDVKRIFKMKYEDIRHVSHAVVQKAPFGWKLKSQKLSQWINCFSSGLEEVRMMISSKNGANREREVCFRSVVDSGPDENRRMLSTELVIGGHEFEFIKCDVEDIFVTFTLKDFKAALILAEMLDQYVDCEFKKPGDPFVCNVSLKSLLNAKFVVATMDEDEDENVPQNVQSADNSRVFNQSENSEPTIPVTKIPKLTAEENLEVQILSQGLQDMDDDWWSDDEILGTPPKSFKTLF